MLLPTIRRLAPAACLAAGACYSYATTVPSSLHDGQGVRVELTETGSGAMASALGPRALTLDGRVTLRTDSSFEVAVSDITRANGVEELWHDAPVMVPRSAVARAQTRRFDTLKTVLLVGAGVVAAILAGRALGSDENVVKNPSGGGTSGSK